MRGRTYHKSTGSAGLYSPKVPLHSLWNMKADGSMCTCTVLARSSALLVNLKYDIHCSRDAELRG